ncbi:hypothetical protein Zmor_023579 [Zophobas morio]|uniref:Uncharacterized protein n=1 Tax=Zophobas morio TaxID=2755281 RepID=A0AA38HYG4_9CUCU|nr:hypothetical protein Zmor_023579 [Zophobas morio]
MLPRYDAYGSSSMYVFLLVCSITHQSVEAAFAKESLEAEVAMDSRKTSIAKHREGNMGLNGGHLRERDYSV